MSEFLQLHTTLQVLFYINHDAGVWVGNGSPRYEALFCAFFVSHFTEN